jgi:uncharacterized metal-binding protein
LPSYKTHDKIAYITAPVLTIASTTVLPSFYPFVFGAVFLAANHWLSPDLDIDSIMLRRWGFLSFIWYPYRKYIHHRSFLSHSGPFSATLRLAYLCLWVVLPLWYFVSIDTMIGYVLYYHLLFYILYGAMVAADTLHTLLDHLL